MIFKNRIWKIKLIKLLKIIFLNNLQQYICLCVIGKNVNLYVKEYINHYKNLGYNYIFIYDNNDINDERFSDIIHREIESGFVSIIDFIGYKSNSDSTQIEAYFPFQIYNNI